MLIYLWFLLKLELISRYPNFSQKDHHTLTEISEYASLNTCCKCHIIDNNNEHLVAGMVLGTLHILSSLILPKNL